MPIESAGSREKEVSRIGNVEVLRDSEGMVKAIRLPEGVRVLFVRTDADQIAAQFTPDHQQDLSLPADHELEGSVNTDYMIAGGDCGVYDERLGPNLLRTFRTAKQPDQFPIKQDAILSGNFGALALGPNAGSGSSREHAVSAMRYAGIGVVYASSFAPIHLQNLVNTGMFPILDRKVMERFMCGEEISIEEIAKDFSPVQGAIMRRGGIFQYMQALEEGEETFPEITTGERPMTMTEKILLAHMQTANRGYVKPGDEGIASVDFSYSHDYTLGQIRHILREVFGENIPELIGRHISYGDHLLFADDTPTRSAGAKKLFADLREDQRQAAEALAIRLIIGKAICHQHVIEEVVRPGMHIKATDSHTCTGGAGAAVASGGGGVAKLPV